MSKLTKYILNFIIFFALPLMCVIATFVVFSDAIKEKQSLKEAFFSLPYVYSEIWRGWKELD